jgi:hypothetical protein
LVWRDQGRIRLDPVRNHVGFVCHDDTSQTYL